MVGRKERLADWQIVLVHAHEPSTFGVDGMHRAPATEVSYN